MLRNTPSVNNFPVFTEESERITHPTASLKKVKFNRWGSLVAMGSQDGLVFIYDFRARSFMSQWRPHAMVISSLSWSRDGRKLLTSSADMTVVVSDVVTGEQLSLLHVGSFVLSATFNPRNDDQCVIMTTHKTPSVENFAKRESIPLLDSVERRRAECVTVITYDKRGKYIITGTNKGRIFIYDATLPRLLKWFSQSAAQQIKQFVMPHAGGYLITNNMDRIIRVYKFDDPAEMECETLAPLNCFQDAANKVAWVNVCCDKIGDYICGVSTVDYSLYIWERDSATLIKILRGPTASTVMDVQWHPTQTVILTVSEGGVAVWSQPGVECWSAFAPGFTELEENEHYAEKEGDFDLEDEDASENELDKKNNMHDEEIDVVGFERDDLLCSSDEDISELVPNATMTSGPLWYIPRGPLIEYAEEPVIKEEVKEGFPDLQGLSIQQHLEAMTVNDVRGMNKRGRYRGGRISRNIGKRRGKFVNLSK